MSLRPLSICFLYTNFITYRMRASDIHGTDTITNHDFLFLLGRRVVHMVKKGSDKARLRSSIELKQIQWAETNNREIMQVHTHLALTVSKGESRIFSIIALPSRATRWKSPPGSHEGQYLTSMRGWNSNIMDFGIHYNSQMGKMSIMDEFMAEAMRALLIISKRASSTLWTRYP